MSVGIRISKGERFTKRNKVKLIRGGKPYFDCLLEMIGQAKESIHFQTYIFDADDTGMMVADALKEAAKRNVKVYLMVDGYASKALRSSFIKEFENAGIHFRFFDPIFKSNHFYFGRRLHQKLVVVDVKYSLVAGINITNRYNDMPGQEAWLDFALFVEGEASMELCVLCWKTWNNFLTKIPATPCKKNNVHITTGEACEVSIRSNDWVRRKNEISATYIRMFKTAASQIIILCSYFLPGRFIRRQMRLAARRGVKIIIITAGISDILLSKYAERYLYGWLLKNNITLYEYQPRILHGKIAVCDGNWLTIGSYNINNLSAYASIELNLNVHSRKLAREAEQILLEIANKDCIAITKEYYFRTRNIFGQSARWFAYQFYRMMLYLFTFYFKQKGKK